MKLLFDVHCHTIASGHAFSTVKELVDQASLRGLKLIALTDHGPTMPGGPHIYHINNQRIIPRKLNEVIVLRGVEANIVDFNGQLDINDKSLSKLDLVIASLHPPCIRPGNVEENTRALIKAMENKYVDIIGHPGNPDFKIDKRKVLEAAKKNQVLIEINNSSFGKSRQGSKSHCEEIMDLAIEMNVKMVFGTDTHIYTQIGDFSNIEKYIDEKKIPKELIANYDVESFIDFLESKGKKDIGEIRAVLKELL